MKPLPPISERAYAVGGTLLVLLALFGYYFLGYLPQQEEKLTAQRVRAMQQIAYNFKEKYKSFQKNGESIIQSRTSAFDTLLKLQKAEEDRRKELSSLFDSLKSDIQGDAINKELKLLRFGAKPNPDELVFLIVPLLNSKVSDTVRFTSSLPSFFASLQREDSFKDYLIFKDKILVYGTTPNEVMQIPGYSTGGDEQSEENSYHIIPVEDAGTHFFPSGLEVKLASKNYKLFSTKFETANHTKWAIYGLEDAKSFQEEAKMFPYLIIVFVSLALLFVFFALPLLKLSFMSYLERLHIRDVVLTSTSFVFCTALVVLALLTVFAYYGEDKREVDENLKELSAHIEKALREEIKAINNLLSSIENDEKEITFKQHRTEDNTIATRISAFNDSVFISERLEKYPYFTNTYWVDQDGFQRFLYSTAITSNKMAEKIDLNDRNYFKAIKSQSGWRDKELIDEPFFVESIFSRISGERMAVFAKASKAEKLYWEDNDSLIFQKKASMIGVATKLYSVIDPVLPPGYTFSIIDPKGNVLFHSDKRKNLQENYLEECNQANSILSAMHSQGEVHADVNYYNRDHRVFVRHLRNFPWYLLVSYDKSFIQSPYLNTSSTAVVGILLIGTVSILISTLVALFYRRSSKLKRQLFPYDWLWPYQYRRNKFFWLGWFNVVLAILLVWYNGFLDKNIIATLASFSYALVISYVVSFAVLARGKEGDNSDYRYRGVLFTTNLLTLLITVLAASLSEEGLTFMGLWMAVCITTLYFAFRPKLYAGERQTLPKEEFKTAGLGTGFLKKIGEKLSIRDKIKSGFSSKSFQWMIFTYLMIASVLPAFYVFRKIYDQEKLIRQRHALYEISARLEERNWKLKTFHQDNELADGRKIYSQARKKGNYFICVGYDSLLHPCNELPSDSFPYLDSLIYRVRPFFNDIFMENSGFVFSSNPESSWVSKRCGKHGLVMEYQRTKYPNEEEPIVLAAQVPKIFTGWGMATGESTFRPLFLLLAVFSLGIFFVGIWNYLGFTIRRLFGLGIYENMDIISVDDKYLKGLQIEKKKVATEELPLMEEEYLNIFIISSPFSSTKDILKNQHFEPINLSEILNETYYQEQVLDKVNKLSGKIVVIEDFGYGIDNVKAGWRTLEVIEKLQTNHNKIVVISKLSPGQVIEKYENLKKTNKDQQLDVFISKWKDVLAEFIEMYFSYVVSSGEPRKKLPKQASVSQLLAHEFSVHKPYFNQLMGSLVNNIDVKNVEKKPLKQQEIYKEELLLKIQSMAQPFYYSLWNACSKDEKFFLYDLATDGFANTKNTKVIIKLLEKGLIFYDESLHIMNESFRNFILDIDKAEALEMEKELSRSGNWRIYRAVIMLAVVSLIVFFIFANESIVKQFSALLAGLAATIPYILRLGGFFNPGSETVKG